jgi:iron complex transport system substrate-binding protein
MDTPSMSCIKHLASLLLVTLCLQPNVSAVDVDGGFPLTVIDDFGRSVTIAAPPTRIVSTAPSNTEILFALGLEEYVVGVTQYCNWPPAVLEKVSRGQITLIGGYADPSLEKIVSLSPDLVLAATDLQFEFVSVLSNRGVVVVALNPKTVSDVVDDIALVGTICGRVAEANGLIENLQRRLSYVDRMVADASTKPRVYYELWYDPLMSFGPQTVVNELIVRAGGENIFHDASTMYPIVSSETVIERDPEIIVVPESYMGGVSSSDFGKRPGWSVIKAVREGSVYTIDENLIVRTGPRIVEGLENIASIIHPELFTGTINYNSSISVTSNVTVFALIYDDSRSLFNFSLIGREGKAFVRVNIEKRLLKGSPVVLVDSVETEAIISESEETYIIDFTSSVSMHQVVVGGAQTIPEFEKAVIVLPVFLALAAAVLIISFRNRSTNEPGAKGSDRDPVHSSKQEGHYHVWRRELVQYPVSSPRRPTDTRN